MKYYGWLSIFKGLLMHFNVTLEVVVCRGWWTKITGVCAFKLCIGRERSSMFYFHDSKGHPQGNSEPPFRTPVRSFRGIRTTVAYTVHPCGRSRRHLAHDRVHSAGITTPNPPRSLAKRWRRRRRPLRRFWPRVFINNRYRHGPLAMTARFLDRTRCP